MNVTPGYNPFLFALLFGVTGIGTVQTVRAEAPPADLTATQVEAMAGTKELLTGAYSGLLLTPSLADLVRDSKYAQSYGLTVYAYRVRQNMGADGRITSVSYARRFAVHAPDKNYSALAQQTARLLLLLWNARRVRLFPDHATNAPTLDVWLTRQTEPGRSADIGGEQFKNQIYLYNLAAGRSAAEWLREIAHEYGHYALPGVSGYRSPEEWANGVLGERLFPMWLAADLQAGRFAPEALPFVSPAELKRYVAAHSAPLVRMVAENGAKPTLLARKDAPGMNAYTALALYLDAVYGSAAFLDALSATQPDQNGFTSASNFLRGTLDSLNEASELTIAPPFPAPTASTVTFALYIPRGRWSVTPSGIANWQLIPTAKTGAKGIRALGKTGLVAISAGWRRIAVTRAPNAASPHLVLRKSP